MKQIKNIKEQDQYFLSGTLFAPMFGKEIGVMIEKEADTEYAERCAGAFIALNDAEIDHICKRICDYHRFMLEEWNEDFVREINEKVPAGVSGRDILNYIENPTLYVMKPQGDGVGYSVAGYCEWEPEHEIEFIMKDNALLYVGQQECLGSWAGPDEYEVDF